MTRRVLNLVGPASTQQATWPCKANMLGTAATPHPILTKPEPENAQTLLRYAQQSFIRRQE
jgi:hypothetical protein